MEILGVALAVAVISSIIFYFKIKKNKKAIAAGKCPKCAGNLINKNINGEDVKLCEKKCGFVAANGMWMETKMLEGLLGAEKDKAEGDVAEDKKTRWMVYKELSKSE